jgi:hypothetical protein
MSVSDGSSANEKLCRDFFFPFFFLLRDKTPKQLCFRIYNMGLIHLRDFFLQSIQD